jgi:hypothetical protein
MYMGNGTYYIDPYMGGTRVDIVYIDGNGKTSKDEVNTPEEIQELFRSVREGRADFKWGKPPRCVGIWDIET